jgi:L-histidine N-alpha-methyltransferase
MSTDPITELPAGINVTVHIDDGWLDRALTAEVASGLTGRPRRLSPRWLYDRRGSQLFDQITRLPEYYPTEAERRILARHRTQIVELTGAETVIELGSGTSDKTRTLLDGFAAGGNLKRFIGFDVSEQTLRTAASQLALRYPGLAVDAVVGDFHHHLDFVPTDGKPLIAFLGSTIGNLYPAERARFLSRLSRWMSPDAHLLIGLDLVKPTDGIIAAYNDPGGVTADFTLNLLSVLNQRLDANFDPDGFRHVGLWDPNHTRVDIRLRAVRSQRVHLPGAELTIDFHEDEELQVEISTKFTIEQITAELQAAGLAAAEVWIDPEDRVAMVMARRTGCGPSMG